MGPGDQGSGRSRPAPTTCFSRSVRTTFCVGTEKGQGHRRTCEQAEGRVSGCRGRGRTGGGEPARRDATAAIARQSRAVGCDRCPACGVSFHPPRPWRRLRLPAMGARGMALAGRLGGRHRATPGVLRVGGKPAPGGRQAAQEVHDSGRGSCRRRVRTLLAADAARTPQFYARAGLPSNESSLHLRQDDGFVHALDLRTINRPEWRNLLAELAFRAMGFHTLRHVGTADHLHVSLRLAR